MNKHPLSIHPENIYGKIGDLLMTPIMYILSGTLSEKPQISHAWNVQNFEKSLQKHIPSRHTISIKKDPTASRAYIWGLPLLHAPLFDGWKKYIVLTPKDQNKPWFVGWITPHSIGVSRIIHTTPVRLLRGNENISFFGVDANTRNVIPLKKIAKGTIGKKNVYSKTPLL